MYDVYVDGLLLPVTPEKIEIRTQGRNETAALINGGEISVLKDPGLSTVKLKALLPGVEYPFARYPGGFLPPGEYLRRWHALMEEKRPFQLIVARRLPQGKRLHSSNLTVTLEELREVDSAGEGFDALAELTMKQYRAWGTVTFAVETPAASAPVVLDPERPASTSPVSPPPGNPGGGGGGGGGGSGGGSGGGQRTQTYKVQIPGMSAVLVKAASVQGAITRAVGTAYTGTVYVDGQSYYVRKGVISPRPAPSGAPGSRPVITAMARLRGQGPGIQEAVRTAAEALGRTPTAWEKAERRDLSGKMMRKN